MKLAIRILVNTLVVLSLPVMILGGLTFAKVVSPLIVISGSMEPTIGVGSLIISTKVQAKDLHPGDVASFEREDGILVTHRVIENVPANGSDELRMVKMKGDANNTEDQHPYVQKEALKPLFIVPKVGSALAAVGNNKYSILAVASFGIGLWLLAKLIFGSKTDRLPRGRRSSAFDENKGVLSNQE